MHFLHATEAGSGHDFSRWLLLARDIFDHVQDQVTTEAAWQPCCLLVTAEYIAWYLLHGNAAHLKLLKNLVLLPQGPEPGFCGGTVSHQLLVQRQLRGQLLQGGWSPLQRCSARGKVGMQCSQFAVSDAVQ